MSAPSSTKHWCRRRQKKSGSPKKAAVPSATAAATRAAWAFTRRCLWTPQLKLFCAASPASARYMPPPARRVSRACRRTASSRCCADRPRWTSCAASSTWTQFKMEVIFHPLARAFIRDLQEEQQGRTLRALSRLERFGPHVSAPHAKKITDGIWELRITGNIQVRLLYTFLRNQPHVLSGFIKKSNKIPPREITLAYQRMGYFTE